MNTPPRTNLAQVGAPRKTLPHVTRLLTAGVTHPGTAFFRPTVPSVVIEQGSSAAPHLNDKPTQHVDYLQFTSREFSSLYLFARVLAHLFRSFRHLATLYYMGRDRSVGHVDDQARSSFVSSASSRARAEGFTLNTV